MAVGVFVVVVIAIKFSLSQVDNIRAFAILQNGGSFDWNVASSGRISEYESYLSDISGINWLIGMGPEIIQYPGMPQTVGGCLSVYVTLLRNVGFFGMFLLLLAFASVIKWGLCNGARGKLVLLLFGAWAITGVAEGSNIRRGGGYRFLQGAAFALCSRAILDSRFQRRDNIQRWNYIQQPMMGRPF